MAAALNGFEFGITLDENTPEFELYDYPTLGVGPFGSFWVAVVMPTGSDIEHNSLVSQSTIAVYLVTETEAATYRYPLACSSYDGASSLLIGNPRDNQIDKRYFYFPPAQIRRVYLQFETSVAGQGDYMTLNIAWKMEAKLDRANTVISDKTFKNYSY